MMKVSDDKIKELLGICEQVVCSGIIAVYEYQKHNSYVPSYYRYPEEFFKGIESDERYGELKEKIPAINSGVTFFWKKSYDMPKNYGDLIKTSSGQFCIDCHSLEQFDVLFKLFYDNKELSRMVVSDSKNIESFLVHFVSNIINRYLYVTGNFQNGEIDTTVVKQLIAERLIRYLSESLKVNICIPICFLDFDSNEVEFSENITICRMNKDFQLSRYNISNYESTQESDVVQCAAFMVKLTGYQIDNREIDSVQNAITNYWAYPREMIDDIFASIRISSSCDTGYGQFLIEPIGWANEWVMDIIPLYGAQVRAFNRNNVDTEFPHYRMYKLTNNEIALAKELFEIIRKERSGKNKEFKKVFIAIDRLNRCLLREAEDDTALDAIIGIETLLSGDTQGEITYTISNRMAVVIAKLENCPYKAQEARKAMRIIYGLRSDIVHGREIKKNGVVTLNGQERNTKDAAIEFLRCSLLFVLKNQDYLDVKMYEEAFDTAIEKINTNQTR